MEGKDDRFKDKRRKMRIYDPRKRGPPQPQQPQAGGRKNSQNTSSSSAQVETVRRSVVDVADSSDDRYMARRAGGGGGGGNKGWASSTVAKQESRRYSLLDTDIDELNDIENAQRNAGDFKLMSELPTSIGGHFQYSSEKNWNTTDGEQLLDKSEASEYFTLNLKLLNVGLQTIPFYKRMDYSASMFTRDQLAAMEQAAEVAEKQYQNVLKEHEMNVHTKNTNTGNRKSGSAKSQRSVKSSTAAATAAAPTTVVAGDEGNTNTDELDELLNLTTSQVANVNLDKTDLENVTPTPAPAASSAGNGNADTANKDDIQQWLDNVLEE